MSRIARDGFRGCLGARAGLIAVVLGLFSPSASASEPAPAYQVRLEAGHPWRPPFGVDRVGRPINVVVEASAPKAQSRYRLTALFRGRAVSRVAVRFPASVPYSARVTLDRFADEVVLSADADPDAPTLARLRLELPAVEADAAASPDQIQNPVDLGTILLPSGWLLLGPGQTATLELAAISRLESYPRAVLKAAFESDPRHPATATISLAAGRLRRHRLQLPEPPRDRGRDILQVVLDDGAGHAIWRKTIPVMLVSNPPRHPSFGATYEHLRYDAPISIRDPKTGAYSSIPYEKGWKPELRDVVVWLPNGARFVFWRGSSYIPFWAGCHNTGLSYEWAEMISRPPGAVDCVEPLMDKELRYGNVEIVESTLARVHVRWTYQSTDLQYHVWGDSAVEDYYFYPDGFGTRVLNLRSDPKNEYELSEFIILTPQGAYPLEVLPKAPIEALFLDGRKRSFPFPNPTNAGAAAADPRPGNGVPAIYRLRLSDADVQSAAVFTPNETRLPPIVFPPFFDKGELVTPCYWGSHWPLARGNATGSAIDDRIALSPCHNSVMSWAGCRPKPIRTGELATLDALGQSRPMVERQWVWLIGMSDESDRRLVDRARSFAMPPSMEIEGAHHGIPAYFPERRAIQLAGSANETTLVIKPGVPCINPVWEWSSPKAGAIEITLDGRLIERDRFAWDGRVLWLNATIDRPVNLRVHFADLR
jgi:hypothetical protein